MKPFHGMTVYLLLSGVALIPNGCETPAVSKQAVRETPAVADDWVTVIPADIGLEFDLPVNPQVSVQREAFVCNLMQDRDMFIVHGDFHGEAEAAAYLASSRELVGQKLPRVEIEDVRLLVTTDLNIASRKAPTGKSFDF